MKQGGRWQKRSPGPPIKDEDTFLLTKYLVWTPQKTQQGFMLARSYQSSHTLYYPQNVCPLQQDRVLFMFSPQA